MKLLTQRTFIGVLLGLSLFSPAVDAEDTAFRSKPAVIFSDDSRTPPVFGEIMSEEYENTVSQQQIHQDTYGPFPWPCDPGEDCTRTLHPNEFSCGSLEECVLIAHQRNAGVFKVQETHTGVFASAVNTEDTADAGGRSKQNPFDSFTLPVLGETVQEEELENIMFQSIHQDTYGPFPWPCHPIEN